MFRFRWLSDIWLPVKISQSIGIPASDGDIRYLLSGEMAHWTSYFSKTPPEYVWLSLSLLPRRSKCRRRLSLAWIIRWFLLRMWMLRIISFFSSSWLSRHR